MPLSIPISSLLLLALRVVAGTAQSTSPRPLTLGLYSTPEIHQRISLEIVGTIPSWVTGSLYRGAAGSWDSGNYTAEHWFDGFSRNHRFEISEGAVQYHNKNASDELRDFVQDTGLWPGGSFGGDPCKVIFGAFQATYRDGKHPVGNTSCYNDDVGFVTNFPGLAINSTNHGPFVTLVSTTDGNGLQQLDPVTLEPIEIFTYQAANLQLNNSQRTASHPAHGSNGNLYNYVLDLSATPPDYKVFVINNEGVGRVLATITDAPPAYVHSIFSTENYVLLIVWQADIGHTAKPTYNLLDTLKPWNPERDTIFYVIDKVSGEVVSKYTTEPFFAFHESNSFEDSETGSIVIDLPILTNYTFLNAARLPNLRAMVGLPNASATHDIPGIFRRYRLPDFTKTNRTANGTIVSRPAVLDFEIEYKTGNIELPRINQAYNNKPYRYSYGVHIEKRGYFSDSIIKIDTQTQATSVWTPATNHLPSEPVFVAKPNPTAEDDGVLLTIALDAERRTSAMVVIDAQSMQEIGRAQMPLVVGYGFHGLWGGVGASSGGY